jgi:hypothetical protein
MEHFGRDSFQLLGKRRRSVFSNERGEGVDIVAKNLDHYVNSLPTFIIA